MWLQASTCKVKNEVRGFDFLNFNGSFDLSEAETILTMDKINYVGIIISKYKH